jgi:Protein of unknown function (DUF2721)
VQATNDVITVAHVIQQSVAPVFLLTGVGAILSVLTSRLSRVIDRFRLLDESDDNKRVAYENEMAVLLRRASWIHWAINLCTYCALFICIVIAALFIGSEVNRDPSGLISIFFIGAMLALIAGLLCFLREITLATDAIQSR